MTTSSQRIIVHFYAGYKGEERPQSILMEGQKYPVEILSRKRCLDQNTGKHYEVFLCRAAGKKARITRDETGEYDVSFPGDTLALPKK
jgi:hypothetical protein